MFFVIDSDNDLVGVYADLAEARQASFPGDRLVFVTNDQLGSGTLLFTLQSDLIGLTPHRPQDEAGLEDLDFGDDDPEGFTTVELSELVETQAAEIEELYNRVGSLEHDIYGTERPLISAEMLEVDDDGPDWN